MKLPKLSILFLTLLILFTNGSAVLAQTFSVSVSGTVPDTTITFDGVTAPNSIIYISDNLGLAGTVESDSAGNFTETLVENGEANEMFSLYGEDSAGLFTNTMAFSYVLVPQSANVISNIVLSPSIQKGSLTKTNDQIILGTAAPGATITVYINGNIYSSTKTAAEGAWQYTILTHTFAPGVYTAIVIASYANGSESGESLPITFTVVVQPTVTQTIAPLATAILITPTVAVSPTVSPSPSLLPTVTPSFIPTSVATPTPEIITPKTNQPNLIFGFIIAGILLLAIIIMCLLILFMRKRRHKKEEEDNDRKNW